MTDRWLVIAHEATNSGAPRLLLEVLRGVRAVRGPEWSCVILLDRGGPLAGEFAELGPVYRLSHPWSEGKGLWARAWRVLLDRPWLKPRRLRRQVREWRSAGEGLIYSNTATNGRLLAALSADAGRVLSHVHELEYGLRRFSRPQDLARTLARSDHFIAVSESVAQDLRALGVGDRKISVVPNFLPVLPSLPDGEAARVAVCRQLKLPVGTRLVVGCGHIDPLKGTDLFIEVARLVVNQVAGPVVFVWVGGDVDRGFAGEFRGAAPTWVRFTGEVADAGLYYAASEAVVVTSRVESFSRVALEAGALGRPVLAYAASRGPVELLDSESLVSGLAAQPMADAVSALLVDPGTARRQGERLRARIARDFLADRWIGRLLAVSEEVANG